MSSNWHHPHLTSASTIDLCAGFDSGGSYLRKSPDQYSSRGSMESLDPPLTSQHHHGVLQHHPLGHHSHSGSHVTYSSCHQLSSARSSNSIDHLHSKRDSAYSSFSTSSSIPEYLASTPTLSSERSYSMETVHQREGGGSGDIHFDIQQGFPREHELSSASPQHIRELREGGGGRPMQSQDLQGSASGVSFYASSINNGSSSGGISTLNTHSMGSLSGPSSSRCSYEDLKGAPAPPRRCDSYGVIRNHDRPNSWSSVEHARSLRSLQRGPWHHSSGSVSSATAKGGYGAEGQLHTVIEKSPESSPTTKPRQGGGFPQPFPLTDPPTGEAGSTHAFHRLILPTSVFPDTQSEPEYAQAPNTNLQSDNHGVYPGVARDAKQQQEQCMQAVQGRNNGPTDGGCDLKVSPENGYPYCLYPTSASTQPRAQPQEAQRHHKGANIMPSKAHGRNFNSNSESQKGQRSPSNQQPNSHSLHGPRCKSQSHHTQVYQEQNEISPIHHTPSVPDLRALAPKEKNDGFTPVQPWEDRNSSLDQSSTHSEPVAYSMPPQGQMPPRHISASSHPPPVNFSTSQPTSRHHSDSGAPHVHHRVEENKDKDHLLTRLENALTDVQQITSPDEFDFGSSHDRSSFVGSFRGPVRSLSVLEKVSRFERREQAGKQRTLSTSASHTRGKDSWMNEKGRSSLCGAEDLRHMLERSTKGSKAHRTLSYRGSPSENTNYRTPADPSSALQRSRSSLHVDGCTRIDSKEHPWREMLAPPQDMPSNRPYRDSLKNIHPKVLRSTSFRQRDISSSVKVNPSSSQPPPVFSKSNSMEKKGPKTMPKPQGVIFTPLTPPPITSPHTPKERHVVSPDVRGQSPPALPSFPPVGLPSKFRVCGRKRLTADQKKRSFSEPDKMNVVGVSEAETDALFRRGGETRVADRRKMFEHTSVCMAVPAGKSDLRQVQHEALAEYVERKKSVKRDKWAQKGSSRPHSVYLQPDNINYTDTLRLSSTSSLLSLQEIGRDQSCSPGKRPPSSALPSGPDLQIIHSNQFYPARMATPRLETHPTASSPSKPTSELQSKTHLDVTPETGRTHRTPPPCAKDLNLSIEQKATEPQVSKGLSKPFDGGLHTIRSVHSSGMSASADNILESLELGQTSHQHHRSRSSPTPESLEQGFFPGEVKMFEVLISESEHCALAANRPEELHATEGHNAPKMPEKKSGNAPHPARSAQDTPTSSTPAPRRERQRNSDRQRVPSSSALAASVGLPCPFSPPGTRDVNISDWQVSERLSQANLDAILFPQTGQAESEAHNAVCAHGESQKTRHSLSDATLLEDSLNGSNRERTFSLGTREETSDQNTKLLLGEPVEQLTPVMNQQDAITCAPSPVPVHQPSANRHFSSLRISESSLSSSMDQHQMRALCTDTPQEDLDDVFLQYPPPPPAPPPPPPPPLIKETIIMEDFPPPPSPVELDEAVNKQTNESTSSETLNNFIFPTVTESLRPFPDTSTHPVPTPAPAPETHTTASVTAHENTTLEYKILPQRERTSEELRAEALLRQLVSQDPSLAPVMNTWGGQSIVERMEEIFTNNKELNSHWPRKGSLRMDKRIRDEVYSPNETTVTDGVVQEKDLVSRKVELCEALQSSLAALQEEKKALCEEQQQHQDLGLRVETLMQEQLKPNEKEKYNMFIGDLDRIVNLLLSLCSRLYRIDQSLLTLREEELSAEEVAEEMESLHHKQTLLLRQTEDARELKENLDRRERVVHTTLSRCLSEPQLEDYYHYVSYKPYFLIYQRYLDDLIRQQEDQLTFVAERLPKEQAEVYGCFTGHSFLGPLTHPICPGPPHTPKSATVTSL